MTTHRRSLAVLLASVAAVAALLAWGVARSPQPDSAAPAVGASGHGAPPSLAAAAPATTGRSADDRGRPGDAASGSAVRDGVPEPTPAPAFSLVVVAADGRPIRGAVVSRTVVASLGGGPPSTASLGTTDAEGRLTLDHDGQLLWVRIRAPGLVQPDGEAALRRGVETRVRLVAAAVVRVRVVDASTGAASPDASVWITSGDLATTVFPSQVGAPRSDEGRTDVDGRVTLVSEPGRAVLYVAPRRGAATSQDLVVEPGGRDVEVKLAAGGRVEGQVLDANEAPSPRAWVRLDVPPAYRREVLADEAGRFAFDDVPEAPVVDERAYDADPLAWVVAVDASRRARGWAVVTPTPAGTVARVTVALASATVRGRVVEANRRPVAGRAVRARLGMPSLDDGIPAIDATTDAEGGYRIVGAVPGFWTVEVLGDVEGRASTSAAVEVPARGEVVARDLVLPERTGRLRFRLLDAAGLPIEGAHVEVRGRVGVVNGVERSGVTDAGGRLAVDGVLVEGVTLHLRVPASAWWLVPVASDDLRSASDVVVRLPSGDCAGRATRLDGTSACVRLRLGTTHEVFVNAGLPLTPDVDGRFRFRGIAADTAPWIEADDEDWMVLPHGTPARPGQDDLRILLVTREEAAGLHVRLRVVDEGGVPVAVPRDATLELSGAGSPSSPALTVGAGVGADGRFESAFPVPPGTYAGVLRVPGYRDARIDSLRLPSSDPLPTVRLVR